MRTIKTILADDHRIFIEGLKAVLARHPALHFEIIGEAGSGMELIRVLKKTAEADLIILDLNLPETNGLEVMRMLKEGKTSIKILALTSHGEPDIIKSAFRFGANGYILKNGGITELYHAIEEVLTGERYMGEGLSLPAESNKYNQRPGLSTSFLPESRLLKKHNLTKRELEILKLIAQAFSNKKIAKELYISDQTVSVHRKNIMRKLGATNTAGLIKIAYDNSIV